MNGTDQRQHLAVCQSLAIWLATSLPGAITADTDSKHFTHLDERVNIALQSDSGQSPNVFFGLGLFDVCPARDEGAGRASICGQTLNKPPGTKPRSAASRFG